MASGDGHDHDHDHGDGYLERSIPPYWFWLEGGALLLAAMIQRPLLVFVCAAALLITTVASWWGQRCLRQVTYERSLSRRRLFFGDAVDLHLRVTNGKLLPLPWLSIAD